MGKPGEAAWRRVRYELEQRVTSQEGVYTIDDVETMTRYMVVDHKVVAQIGADDIDWLITFGNSIKPFGAYE